MNPLDIKLAKELVEERQREILEDVEAEKLAEGDIPVDVDESDDYNPVTDDKRDAVPTHKRNKHVHGYEK
jgi:hypothetical protein